MTAPRRGEVWQQGEGERARRVRILEDPRAKVAVANVDTGRRGQIDVWAFSRGGNNGWRRIAVGDPDAVT